MVRIIRRGITAGKLILINVFYITKWHKDFSTSWEDFTFIPDKPDRRYLRIDRNWIGQHCPRWFKVKIIDVLNHVLLSLLLLNRRNHQDEVPCCISCCCSLTSKDQNSILRNLNTPRVTVLQEDSGLIRRGTFYSERYPLPDVFYRIIAFDVVDKLFYLFLSGKLVDVLIVEGAGAG